MRPVTIPANLQSAFAWCYELVKSVLSVVIPAHNEERFIGRCIESVLASAQHAGVDVELVVALNRCTDRTREIAEASGALCVIEDRKCIAAVRNAGVRASAAESIVTIDADSWMSTNTIAQVLRCLDDRRYIGGGTMMYPERWSIGIVFSALAIAPYVVTHGVSAGMFWLRRDVFETLGGFDERFITVEDLDFALRLKALGKTRGLRYGTVWRGGITTSCRKFDQFGDWYLFWNPRLVRHLFTGKDQAAADLFYYNVRR
jgi:glycosyltransferase involved in cell wall biosynthesis